MSDDRTFYDRFLFGMSHVVWVSALIFLLIFFLRG